MKDALGGQIMKESTKLEQKHTVNQKITMMKIKKQNAQKNV